ncbi:oligosaccharide flippase family protein [Clostridium polynesiense]|uniref:oligosaccharide flippase family protein n=1 Tax=Clostridium polynesiense TaxID=1325933 RepID=UPI00058E4EC1|nr:oligosaccharide flippase family protein [Clostridium polynesiense]
MGKRIKAFLTMGFASVIQVLINVLRTKLIAVILGPFGISITSYLNNFIATITSFTNLGINNGIIKEISKDKDNKEYIKKVEATSYAVTTVLSIIAVLIIAFMSKNIAERILKDTSYYSYIIISSIAIPFLTLNLINISVINGFSGIKELGKANVISSIVSLIVSTLLTLFFKTKGAVYSIPVTAFITCIVYFFYGSKCFKSNGTITHINIKDIQISVMKPLIRYGIVVIFTSVLTNYSMLFIRTIIINNLGIEANGIFQSVWAMTNQYMMLILSALTIYYMPTLCSKGTKDEMSKEMNDTLNLVLKLIVPVLILVLNTRWILIRVLYSAEFVAASIIVPIFLIADFFKTIAWCLGMPLYTIPKLKMQIIAEIIYDGVMILFTAFFINKVGLFSIGIGYFVSQLLLSITYYFYMKKTIDFELIKKNLKLIITSVIALALTLASSYFISKGTEILISVGILILWIKINIDKSEVTMAIEFVKNKINKKLN